MYFSPINGIVHDSWIIFTPTSCYRKAQDNDTNIFISNLGAVRHLDLNLKWIFSGVTRVGVSRGGNWWVSPYFFLENIWQSFLFIASESDDLFLFVVSSPLPSSHTSFIQCFQPQTYFRSGVTPRGCHPGQFTPPPVPLPLSDATVDFNNSRHLRLPILHQHIKFQQNLVKMQLSYWGFGEFYRPFFFTNSTSERHAHHSAKF